MKLKQQNNKTSGLWNSLIVVLLGLFVTGQAHAQIFVANNGGTSINEYTLTGTQVGSSALISGLTGASEIAASGSDLFVSSGGNSIAEYTFGGALVNASLITGLSGPVFTVSGSNIYVANSTGTVGVYTLGGTPGTIASSNAALFSSGITSAGGITVSGTNIFISNQTAATIGEYTTSGATVFSTLTSTPNDPQNMVVLGLNLYLDSVTDGSGQLSEYTLSGPSGTVTSSSPALNTNLGFSANPNGLASVNGNLLVVQQYNAVAGAGTVSQYNTSGTSLNGNFISGLTNPAGIAVATPEPSTWAMMLGGLILLAIRQLRKRRETV